MLYFIVIHFLIVYCNSGAESRVGFDASESGSDRCTDVDERRIVVSCVHVDQTVASVHSSILSEHRLQRPSPRHRTKHGPSSISSLLIDFFMGVIS